ncbi:DUF2188 domain-containing protein [Sporosarcina aquimarina]|uniref:DUF2188 domain-containing protein n=1 Tax=Sporosarcina aquimarina TaxID=114975 RepID=A0ABU4FZM1_9BACL|nr:hypothetical protein [Sporosarcina aquimarina]MDW0110096.1 hypothetical protein [Sporosarcina aquimarina]
MPWSKNDYPDTFKNVSTDVRNKAIEISNALLKEGYEEGRAISIGLSQAREAIEGKSEDRPHYEVKARDDDWVLRKKNSTSVIYSEDTKNVLLEKAKPYVTDHDGVLTVYHADGTKESTLYE